ncbi:MAG: MBL fold metallo-hydrolase [Archaeoglobaceae archaeon]|nr:MBL fold metallo-hydrolase [Archaeoglobaceae archaeon]MCX8151691.1 MBL fold metallo-hydrolase [Archaeoglobaceae archaeon]MDW8013031.1 MBL fold metallo-hydrolase [Archaeoglobaceae archaeon]
MKIVFLGTGDSTGTPVINCHCRTCDDARTKNWERKRFSILIKHRGKNVLVDTSPDLRRQLLDLKIERIDAVLWTHAHFDHFGGIAEFYRVQDDVEVFSAPEVHESVEIFGNFIPYKKREVSENENFKIADIEFELLRVHHPPVDAFGVLIRFEDVKIAISGDTNSEIPEKTVKEFEDSELFIVNALAPTGKFKKHMNALDALRISKRLRVKNLKISHASHLYPPKDEAKKIYPLAEDYEEICLDSMLEGQI